jgi:hypothetical protein
MRTVSWDEVKNASAHSQVYLDGSGSTIRYWDSDAGQAFLQALRSACNLRICWLDDNGRQRPLGPSVKTKYQGGGGPDLSKISNAMFITDDDLTAIQQRDIANHNIEVVTFRQLGIGFKAERLKAERPARPAYTLWDFDYSKSQAEQLAERVDKIVSDYDDIMKNVDNKQVRNKRAIELHARIDRVDLDLAQLSTRAAPTFLESYPGWIPAMQSTVEQVLDTLLRDVFKIFEKYPGWTTETNKGTTVPHRTSCQPQGTRTETYSNGDVAGVTIEYCGQQFTGSAKRNPVDKPNPTIGLAVAEAKAARKLAVSLQRAANKMVADADRNRRKEQAAKATAKNQRRREQQEASDRKNATRYRQENERLVAANNKLKSEAKNVSEMVATRRPATPRKAATPAKKKAAPRKKA